MARHGSDYTGYTPPPTPPPSWTRAGRTAEVAQMRRDKKRAAAFKEGGDNKKKGSGHDAWPSSTRLLRAAFAGRASIYAAHGLKGRVDNHGCDRIGKKIQSELKAIATGWGMSVTANDLKMPVGAETVDETLELLMERLESGGGSAGGDARKRVRQEKESEGDE